jgi:lipopolysaccharide transport system permease protein
LQQWPFLILGKQRGQDFGQKKNTMAPSLSQEAPREQKKALVEQGYDAERGSGSVLQFLQEAILYPVLLYKHRTLVRNFFRREFQSRFRGSLLGSFWTLIHPLFLFITYYLVFGMMFNVRSPEGMHSLWYSFYLFTGVLAWTVFAETTVRCTTVVVENGNLIKKVAFPAQVLPVHIVSVNLVVFIVGSLAYFVIAALTGFAYPGLNLLLLPLVLVVLMFFTIGVGLILAALNVFFRDVNQIFPILANLWFFATPVFWYDEMLMGGAKNNPQLETILTLLQWNPLNPIIKALRAVLCIPRIGTEKDTLASVLGLVGQAALPALAAFLIGFVLFRSLQYRFADEV